MNWSLSLGRIAGVKVLVHWTFLILLAWVFGERLAAGAGVHAAIEMVLFVLAVFACVLLHELGHALSARLYGVRTKFIVLLPIGGVANLESIPKKPLQELVIALAGPAVNVVIALLVFSALLAFDRAVFASRDAMVDSFVLRLALVNLFLVVFNMIPAFPMDGGRVLRALLAQALGRDRATAIAAGVGQVCAVLFAIAGFYWNPILLLIAVLVFFGARAEANSVRGESQLAGLTARDAMMTRFVTLDEHATLARAREELLAGAQQDFPIVSGDAYRALLTRADLLDALRNGLDERPAVALARTDIHPASEDEPLASIVASMQRFAVESFPVVAGGRLVGLLTRDNILEAVAVRRR